MRRALLLLNFGTPAAPRWLAVARYLRQLLSDRRVLTVPAPLRWLLGGLLIPLFRARASAHAYRSIWLPQGSPLRVQTEQLQDSLQAELGDSWRVWHAMRLGQPSVPRVLEEVRRWQPDELCLLSLYPQYASSTVGSVLEQALAAVAKWERVPRLHVVSEYAEAPGLAEAFVEPLRNDAELRADLAAADQVLFSFHGLPISQIESSCDAYSPHCPCTQVPADRQFQRPSHCYRGACHATARAIAAELDLAPEQWQLGFQSRLGPGWLQPYSDQLVATLAAAGHRRLLVFCPSFTTDCLETVEEIGMRLRDTFIAAGGEKLTLVPAPGAGVKWLALLCGLLPDSQQPHTGERP